ncbi:MAG: 50S ribosomal protein L11 methyltransferase [Alphaproteobacteria bacterium]|nr:50S ribosomal protein L11 methyltransferase [Alphaproteobacteria bacterium]MBU0795663.1 50S ribosomal protein L11 methyltransferase [Alphaproteobacteria bacterium]MBU0887286.1 50S ribosomal protein L11 methyltransferase [Alphaproteobacteria bacterium]MBU1811833.1 50S ribosomal protein L11 methyltransferase [Alphaproteobacteria bacterium]
MNDPKRTGGYRIELDVPVEHVLAFSDVVENFASAVAMVEIGEGKVWRVEGFGESLPDKSGLVAGIELTALMAGIEAPAVKIQVLPWTDWLLENRRRFPPIRIDRFFVHGSHYTKPKPAGSIPLLIDAALAFGSGEHATTRGCLMATGIRAKRRKKPLRVLDMGCGSGILGIAAAKVWPCRVLVSDIDPIARDVAHENTILNRVPRVRAIAGPGYRNPLVKKRGPYDLIYANILARPLCRMAKDLKRHLAPGGVAVLSGLTARQEMWVLSAHRAQRLYLKKRIPQDGWHTLMIG